MKRKHSLKPTGSWRKKSSENVKGFIVVRRDGWYLGHDMAWYPHPDMQNAYVHTAAAIVAAGEKTAGAQFVIEAEYDRASDSTRNILAQQIPFADFLAQHKTESPRVMKLGMPIPKND